MSDLDVRKDLKEGVTLLLIARDEEPRIQKSIEQFRPYVDAVVVVEDRSSDNTFELAKKFADKVVKLDTKNLPEIHQSHAYNEGIKHVETEWTLVADCDEIWDQGFLMNMKEIIKAKSECFGFRFVRLNLPHGEAYPDYQIRLVKTLWTYWERDPHSVPCLRAVVRGKDEILEGTTLDNTSALEEIGNAPIIHLPRRKDIKREWWT